MKGTETGGPHHLGGRGKSHVIWPCDGERIIKFNLHGSSTWDKHTTAKYACMWIFVKCEILHLSSTPECIRNLQVHCMVYKYYTYCMNM